MYGNSYLDSSIFFSLIAENKPTVYERWKIYSAYNNEDYALSVSLYRFKNCC